MRKRSWIVFAGLTLFGFAACGGDPETKAAAQSPIVKTLADEACNLMFRCCARGEANYYLGPYVDVANCSQRIINSAALAPELSIDLSIFGAGFSIPNLGALELAAAEGRGSVDGPAIQACTEYLAALECNKPLEPVEETCTPPDPLEEEELETPCEADKLFVGLVALGGVCSSALGSLECQKGLVCRVHARLGVEGVCMLPGDIGASCFSSTECADDLYCSQLDGTCQLYRQQGETCVFIDRDSPSPNPGTLVVLCEPGLSCDPVTDTCVAPCERGALCTADEECYEEEDLKCVVGRCDKERGQGLPCAEDDDCIESLHCGSDPLAPAQRICTTLLDINDVCLTHTECQSEFCDASTGRCAPQVAPGGVCPSGEDAQCAGGSCESESTFCTTNADCTLSGVCNTILSYCSNYCVELLPDGAICRASIECDSGACVAGFCRTPPLLEGQACELDTQCESDFCSLDAMRVCMELPLDLGEPCSMSEQCDSGVCFGSLLAPSRTCTEGLGEGEACGDIDRAPCNPRRYYCDQEATPVVCVPLLETGELCESSVQCRGECAVRFGRMLCAPPPIDSDDELAVCDGSDPG